MIKLIRLSILSFLLSCSVVSAQGADALIKEEIDTNKDGTIDKIIYKDAQGILRKQVWDLGPKQKTMMFFYSKDNQIERAQTDTNNNGITDVFIEYKNGLMSKVSRDKDEDGKPEYWSFYQGGVLEHSEVDTNNDGKADEWFYYVGKQVVRHDKDTNFDGKPDFNAAQKKGLVKIEQDTDLDGKIDRKSI